MWSVGWLSRSWWETSSPRRSIGTCPRTTATRCASSGRLAEHAGLVDRSNRDIIAITGPERIGWLHNLTTQHLLALQPGRGHRAAGAQPARARRAPRGAHRRRRDDLAGRRAGYGGRAAGLPDQDAVHDPRRADRRRRADWALLSLVGPEAAEAVAPAGRASCRVRRCVQAGSGSEVRLVGAGGATLDGLPDRRAARRRLGPPARTTGSTCWCPRSDVDKVADAAGGAAGRDLGVRSTAGRAPRSRGWASRPTTARSPPKSICWLRRSTWTRAAIAVRRRWPGCTISAGRRAAWCCCTSTASAPISRRRPVRR